MIAPRLFSRFSAVAVLSLVPFVTVAGAQTAAPQVKASVQVRGGLNFATTEYDPDLDDEVEISSGTGPNIGLLLEMRGASAFRFLTGIAYDARIHTESIESYGLEYDVNMHYISIPILIGVNTAPAAGGPGVFLNGGVEPAFCVSSEIEWPGTGEPTFDAPAFDFGLRGEAGMVFKSASGTALLLGLGYTFSLTDHAPDQDDSSGLESPEFSMYHRVFRIFAAVSFGG